MNPPGATVHPVRVLVAASAAGVGLGVAARLAMRLVALAVGMPGSFSAGGSFEVILFGALLGTPLAALFFQVRRRIPWPAPLPGLLFGLAIFGVLSAIPPPAARSALASTPGSAGITAVVFAAVFAAWGIALDLFASRGHRPGAGA